MEALIALALAVGAWLLFRRSSQLASAGTQGLAAAPQGLDVVTPIDGSTGATVATQSPVSNLIPLDALPKKWEGLSLTEYPDEGHTGIGYGHDLLPGESYPDGIDQAKADDLLAADVQKAVNAVQRLVTVPLSNPQLAALVDFVFNEGPGALERSTLLKKLNSGDYNGAADQFTAWDYAGGQPNDNLLQRRQDELAMFTGSDAGGS